MSHRPTRHPRGLGRLLLALVLVMISSVLLAGPAAAHTGLAGSDPAEGATLTAAPTVVTLTFDAAMVDIGATVVITGPDGQPYPTGIPVVDGAEVRTEVTSLGPNGTYTIGYRVVSGDGHPVDGEIPFQLEVPPAPAPEPSSAAAGPPPASSAVPTTAAGPVASPSASSAAVTAPSASSAAPSDAAAISSAAPTTAAVAETAASEPTGMSGWLWAGVAVVLVLVAAGVTLFLRQRRGSAG